MKLLSARIANYRVHSDTQIGFSGNPTLIAGPNESGKSTLIEALHRGLFLRSTAGGEVRERMVSHAGGIPEVEIAFEVDGARYLLRKRFAGTKGTSVLELPGEPAITGPEADDRIAALLGVDAPIGGPGAVGSLARRWAHLWIRQGRSDADPSAESEDHHGLLVRRLQEIGGAGAMQSSLDHEVQTMLADHLAAIATLKGEPKAGTPLHAISAGMEDLQARDAAANDRLARLESAVSAFERSGALIAEKSPALELSRRELADAMACREQLRALQAELTPLVARLEQLLADTAKLRADSARIASVMAAIPALRTEVAASERAAAETAAALRKAEEDAAKAGTGTDALREQLDAVQTRREAFRLLEQTFRLRIDLDDLTRQRAALDARESALQSQRAALAALPRVTTQKLTTLRGLHHSRLEAEAALKALATHVEVLKGHHGLRIGGQPAEEGNRLRFSGTFEIEAGIHLRITPGGGESLAAAQSAFEATDAAFAEALAALQAHDLPAAEQSLSRRKELEAAIQAAEAAINEAGGRALIVRLEETTNELAATGTRAQQLATTLGPAPPASRQLAAEAFEAAEAECQELRVKLAGLSESRTRTAGALAAARAAHDSARMRCESATKLLGDTLVQLQTLEEAHGTATERQSRLVALTGSADELSSRKQSIDSRLAGLGADRIEERITMLDRAVELTARQIQSAREERATAAARLEEAGSGDPVGELAEIRDQIATLESRRSSAQLRLDALRLLVSRFKAHESALEKAFTRPLLDHVDSYLGLVFGPHAHATASYRDNQFSGLALDRSADGGGVHPFEVLSGGTREQLGVAFRLAVAGIVAEAHGGCLPLVLDDAFVNSDPARLKSLLIMLHRAASNGLQVILCTCNPSDYASLGASEVRLPSTSPG